MKGIYWWIKIITTARRGGISLPFLIVLVISALAVGIMLPHTFEVSQIINSDNTSAGCGVKTSDDITYTAPAEEIIPVDPNDRHYKHKDVNENVSNLHLLASTSYKHIRTRLPVYAEQFQTDPGDRNLENHFIPWGQPKTLQNGKTYRLYYPNWATDVFFGSHFTNRQIMMDFGFMIGVELDKNGVPQVVTDSGGKQYEVADVFQDIHNPNPMPEEIFTKPPIPDTSDDKGCIPLGNAASSRQTIVTPTGTFSSQDKKQLQLQTFSVIESKIDHVWNVDCKPAIYLYPYVAIPVHVEIGVKGILTHTIPRYNPVTGWNVTANPDGSVMDGLQQYPYLYYESKVNDSAITVPQTGYVEAYDDLDRLYQSILPSLGLTQRETHDFVSYWHNILPKSPYYFVGVMTDQAIDAIEPLTIIPKPVTIIRVRLYFQPRNTRISVEKPVIMTPVRDGFTVVEWGGMVKRDLTHPFTCSQ